MEPASIQAPVRRARSRQAASTGSFVLGHHLVAEEPLAWLHHVDRLGKHDKLGAGGAGVAHQPGDGLDVGAELAPRAGLQAGGLEEGCSRPGSGREAEDGVEGAVAVEAEQGVAVAHVHAIDEDLRHRVLAAGAARSSRGACRAPSSRRSRCTPPPCPRAASWRTGRTDRTASYRSRSRAPAILPAGQLDDAAYMGFVGRSIARAGRRGPG